jgi:NitT/TauT family transport system substrate-binding protein
MKTRSIISASIAGIVLLSVIGIALNSGNLSDENKIRIAYFPNIGHAIPIVGMEKGFFEASIGNMTQIETRVFDSGPQAIESLFANSIDLAYVGPGPAINGFLNSENHNVKILAGAASGGASFIVHPSSVMEFSETDFAGKKIAAPQIGNTQDVSLRHYLSEHGLTTAEKGGSVIVYNIPNPDIYTLFVKGDIDGAWVAEPWATILETELNGTRLFHEEELWPNQEFASVLLIGNADFVEKNPKLITNLLDSHRDTATWINQNPVETRIIFNNFMTSHLGQSLSDDVVDIALSNLVITDDPLPDSVHSFAEKADTLGYLGRNGYDLSGIFYYLDTNSDEGDNNP